MKAWKGALIGFVLGFVILTYWNYLPDYCTNLPKCNEEGIPLGTDCCPDVGNFRCVGFVQSGSCTFSTYLVNPFSYILAISLALLGIIIGYFINKNEY